MLIPLDFLTRERGILNREDYEESFEHVMFTERLRKTLYYGKTPNKDRPSLPVTELTVGFLQDAAPRQLGKVDLTLASEVSREACISPCSLMLGMIYVERLKHRNPDYLQQVSSSDLFLISMMMASKYLYDEGVDEEVFNDEWAESAGMDVEELNSLERDFLRAIDWQLFVKPADFYSLLERIERGIAYTQCKERGFHTYTDLTVLSQYVNFNQAMLGLLSEISKVLMVCSVAYLAGLMTMLGSTMTLLYLHQNLTPHSGLQPLPPLYPTTTTSDLHHLPPPSSLQHSLTTATNVILPQTTTGQLVNGTRQGMNEEEESSGKQNIGTTTPERSQSGLGMTGFLTLAIIKDTFLQFMEAVTPPDRGRSGVWDDDEDDSEIECRCGGCMEAQVDSNKHCINISGDGQWRSKNGLNLRKLKRDCGVKNQQRCCCRKRPPTLPWYSKRSVDSWLDVPFHNVVLGFGTTAEPLVAG